MGTIELLVTITVLVRVVSCAKILGVFPVPSISHQVVYTALTMELARRGHELTVITTDPVKDHGLTADNYKQINVHSISYKMWRDRFNFVNIRDSSDSPKYLYPHFKDEMVNILAAQMKTEEVRALLENSTQTFDLLIMESLVPSAFSFAWKYKVPYIGMSSSNGFISNFVAVGNPTNPVLYPDIYREKVGKLSIWDKINAIYGYLYIRYVDYTLQNKENEFARKHFGDDTPPVHNLEENMDMLFINVNPLLVGIRPMVPVVVNMGGVHLKPKKELPKDLQTFLDEAREGVIYMSLGSNVLSKDLSPETLRLIMEVFEELPYKVLWKFEDVLPNAPSNVKTHKWLPQQDLLGHKNIKAFITQGGQQSLEEAIRDQVPLIGIPFLGDQDLNVQNMIMLGIGVGLKIKSLTKDNFKQAIMTVTTDPKYKRNVARLSQLVADQPMSGLERAVWWTEYVLRHSGAKHLRAPAAGLSLQEYFMLDVVAAIAAALGVMCAVFVITVKLLYRKMCGESKLKTN